MLRCRFTGVGSAGASPPRPDAPRRVAVFGTVVASIDCIGVATVVFRWTDVGRGSIALLWAVRLGGWEVGVAGYVVTVSGSVCPVALPGGGAYDRAGPIPSFFSHQPNKSFAIRVS